jgi:uncharacterized membrane protein YdjX (TVP38/TMEM64 family)
VTADRRRAGWSFLGGIVFSTAFVAVVVGVLLYFDLQSEVLRFLRWLDGLGLWAPILFSMVMAAVVVLLLPGVLLTTGAGFVFGVAIGTVCVVIGSTLGAALAFLLARSLFGHRAARYVLQNPKLAMLDSQLPPHAWKIVLVTRLIPFFPAKLANYFFGLTSVSLRAFTFGTLLGFIPLSLHNVYLGAIAAELTTQGLRTAGYGEHGWMLYGAGFVIVVTAVVYLGRWAWRALYEGTGRNERAATRRVEDR